MNYKHTSYPIRQSQAETTRRVLLINQLAEIQPYFAWLKYFEQITANIGKYPNSFFDNVYNELAYCSGTFEEQPELKKKYQQFILELQRAVYHFQNEPKPEESYIQQYTEASQGANYQPVNYGYQQYYTQPQTQSGYSQGQGYQVPQNYQQFSNYQGFPQQPQGAYQQPQPYYPPQYPQQPYTAGYGQGQAQGQGQSNYRKNHQNPNYHPRNNQGYGEGYHPRGENEKSHNYNRNHPRAQGGETREHHKKFHEKGGYHHQNHHNYQRQQQQDLFDQNVPYHEGQTNYSQPVTEIKPEPVPQPVPEPVKVELPPPPPPKPEPKPTKFTIKQIKDFINAFSKEELEEHANPEVVAKAKEISEWKSEQVEVKLKQDQDKYKRKQNKKDDGKNPMIKTGVRRDEAKEAERLGYKGTGGDKVTIIVVGAKETLETRQMKVELRKKAIDFVGQKLEEEKNLDQVQRDRREIVYNLNLIVPENLKDIEKDLLPYLLNNEEVCKILIQEVIKKAWDQPKYASTYAKLCLDFSKKSPAQFKFETNIKAKDNPYKFYLIQAVQHSFDQKIQKFPQFQSAEDKDIFLKDVKKKILSNVKFIAELILCKILKRKTIKYCISQLFESFFRHYYAFIHDNKIEDSVYDYHYQAIIEFIENIGEKYDGLDEKEKEKEKEQKGLYSYKQIKDHVEAVLNITSPPNIEILDKLGFFTGDQYFDLLKFMNETFIKKKFPRLSALLQNLVERRHNNWQKHLSVADGPKKLKEIQEDADRQEDQMQGKGKETKISKQKKEQELLDKKVKELFEGWQMGKNEDQREIRDILKKYSEYAFYLSFLKQVADQKKDNVIKRVTLFPVVADGQKFNPKEFKRAWFEGIKFLAFGSGDFPFCGAAIAKILITLVEKIGKLEEFYKKFDDEDEEYFMQEIIQKYHHYTQDPEAAKLVKPKAKYSGLI